MSKHIFTTTRENETVEVTLGWDRPLQGFYMTVERQIDESDDEDNEIDPYIYLNLFDTDLEGGISYGLDYFIKKLSDLGISVPESIFKEVYSDGERNVGNRIVRYSFEGDQLKTQVLCAA